MATIDDKKFIDAIIEGNGWHPSTIESEEDKYAPDNPRVAVIVEYENFVGKTTWGVTFIGEKYCYRYLDEGDYIKNPKVIWQALDNPIE